MKLNIALVEMDGVRFGLAVVPENILDDPGERSNAQQLYENRIFRDLPVVLVGEEFLTAPRFFGRDDLAEFMENVMMDQIEWTALELPG